MSAFSKDWDFPLRQRKLGMRDVERKLFLSLGPRKFAEGATCNIEESLRAEQSHKEPSSRKQRNVFWHLKPWSLIPGL